MAFHSAPVTLETHDAAAGGAGNAPIATNARAPGGGRIGDTSEHRLRDDDIDHIITPAAAAAAAVDTDAETVSVVRVSLTLWLSRFLNDSKAVGGVVGIVASVVRVCVRVCVSE
jgi:hypothetical protein